MELAPLALGARPKDSYSWATRRAPKSRRLVPREGSIIVVPDLVFRIPSHHQCLLRLIVNSFCIAIGVLGPFVHFSCEGSAWQRTASAKLAVLLSLSLTFPTYELVTFQ